MKRLLIIAMTTLAASSSFAMSDVLNCIGSNAIYVNTLRYNNEDQLRMTVQILATDTVLHAKVSTQSSAGSKLFYGTTTDGRAVTLKVKRFNKAKSVLSVDGLADQVVSCKERGLFEM